MGMSEIQNNAGEVIGGSCLYEMLFNIGCCAMQEQFLSGSGDMLAAAQSTCAI